MPSSAITPSSKHYSISTSPRQWPTSKNAKRPKKKTKFHDDRLKHPLFRNLPSMLLLRRHPLQPSPSATKKTTTTKTKKPNPSVKKPVVNSPRASKSRAVNHRSVSAVIPVFSPLSRNAKTFTPPNHGYHFPLSRLT